MKFIPPLSDSEFQILSDAHRQSEKLVLRCRAHAILLNNEGYTLKQIGDILDVTRLRVLLRR